MIRFEHINQACRNLDETQKFYQLLFPDWYVRVQGEFNGSRWMHFGNRQFYLSLGEGYHNFSQSPNTHIDHVGFVIEDGEKMKALLDAHDIPYETYESPETKYRIYVTDPDGTQIELVEYQETYELK
ncbi:MAG: bleomycin resistance protein [Cyanobacteria bacterium CRU_2_1]|nr:bleomycin resistance protein [Cyanobacteria bacterium RU_5_0]NJR61674.1 bleomycin resistance protein [Cyanobacteria bacterium CRU_2_1]